MEALNHFMSKWMDATMHAAVFHLQSKHYDGARPPNFFDHDGLNKLNLTRARKRHGEKQGNLAERRLKSVVDCAKEIPSDDIVGIVGDGRSRRKLFSPPSPHSTVHPSPGSSIRGGYWDMIPPTPNEASLEIRNRTALNAQYFPSSSLPNQNFAFKPKGRTPPLFLQELAHLSSLACAVALSTLRNDAEGCESPLGFYVAGSPWPAIDPDDLPRHVRNLFQHPFRILHHWLGLDRLPRHRAKYNAARPFLIIGGISDSEILFLQRARGPHAKAQLAASWLLDFMIREHLGGSLGEVHSAIISRLVQFLSDGMLFYNEARKIMYIPFPFPHAQLSAFFTVLMGLAVPFMMDQYTNVLWIGSLLTFMTVTCLVGLHEVARELENPFRNVPNEIPLCTLQAMYNETLATMFSGYNPDSFWDAEMYQGALQAMALGRVAAEREGKAPRAHRKTVQDAMKVDTAKKANTPSNGKQQHVKFGTNVETKSGSPVCGYQLL